MKIKQKSPCARLCRDRKLTYHPTATFHRRCPCSFTVAISSTTSHHLHFLFFIFPQQIFLDRDTAAAECQACHMSSGHMSSVTELHRLHTTVVRCEWEGSTRMEGLLRVKGDLKHHLCMTLVNFSYSYLCIC